MRIMIIGQSGAGKSTLARRIQAITGSPLLALDSLWLTTDYSEEAKQWLFQEQERFMSEHKEWIIEGNYLSISKHRIEQADLIIWLRISRHIAIYRVIKRSIKYKRNKQSRPDVPESFSEKLDKEYWDFLRFVWRYKKDREPVILEKLTKQKATEKLVILTGRNQQKEFLQQWQK